MCYALGAQASSVMDEEAINIFWDYIDTYWYSNLSTDDMFAEVYTDTADSIMGTGSGNGIVLKAAVLIAAVAAVLIGALMIRKRQRRKREQERQDVTDPRQNGY